ncbi:nucleotide pyrophosphohydrolase [Candidatus Saccharibacteria bacterium]|nr:nucleotide pyrophosphohydrolase [Candidatus Saccharibacteria bacterium]
MAAFDMEKNLQQLGDNFSVSDVQEYVKEMYKANGWTSTDPRDRIIYLAEEVGELAHATRKHLGHSIDLSKEGSDTVEDEVADVFITLCAYANVMGIDINQAFLQKQAKNCKRSWAKKDTSTQN